MNPVIVTDISHPSLAPYTSLTEAQLRSRLDPAQAVMVVESPKVILTAISAGYRPISLLAEMKHIEGDARPIIDQFPEMPVYSGSREMLAKLTGYTLTRGVLCAMKRPQWSVDTDAERLRSVLAQARRVAVIDSVVDTTNIGAIFRSAAALGFDTLLLTPQSCDPFNRRSIRVSMGSVFLMPWAWIDSPLTLKDFGFTTVAMALRGDSVELSDPKLTQCPSLAVIVGNEGHGLSQEVIDGSDYVATIPMAHGVDSLNVAAAAAIAFYALR